MPLSLEFYCDFNYLVMGVLTLSEETLKYFVSSHYENSTRGATIFYFYFFLLACLQ